MLPRQHQARHGDGRGAAYRASRYAWGATVKRACTCAFLLSFALLFVSVGAAPSENGAKSDGESQPPVLSHFNGLHTLSGASYRAFKNRLKRQMRGESCLRYHVAGTWWHYEWCVDKHVRQFHPQPAGPKAQKPKELSILLGAYNAEKPQPLRVLAVDNLARLADPDRMGYMAQQLYGSGDYCEERGAPRMVKLQVKCCAFHDNETYVDSVEEKAPCEYEMNVCSPVACGLMQRDQFVLTAPTYMEGEERKALAKTVRDMFYHAYNGYLKHAFPQDDLLPLSCRGGEFELGRLPMLTLVDTLDTLAVLEDATEFRRAVELVVENADFNLDTEVSVFETTIRLLGGLLSAHLFAVNTDLKLYPDGDYDGALLRLAVDLGVRLMPAFDTVTGIPYGTVNLKHGVPKGETPIASTAGAGSLSIEFTMLSVLTGDPKYAAASRGAVRALFQRRSKIGLLGKHINTKNGDWTETSSGPGSNSDSFYEYLLKMYELFGDREALEMFAQVYPAVLAHNKHGDCFKASRAFPNMELVVADPVDACSEVSNLPEERLRGKIVLAQRGECFFETKARNAEKWGAAGVIIVNTEDDDLVMVMGGVDENSAEATDEPLDIPVVMVPERLGEWFETRLVEAEASSLAPVVVSIELTVRHHDREVDQTRRRGRGISGDRSFPRIDGTADNMKVYGPVWGVELITMGSDSENGQDQEDDHQESFTIAIVGTPPWQH
ncbi:ER degradation-enhancing alpha-mannosidase-like protein [Phytophthora cinnamomi]|uniref:ER degradation-enhancing alpha-mannosidase-like protein n=1 Tax=Phytophthora cinnamomi TaxID=4785 RepID=UPI003559EB28|nr:ER degradation-enhancing alpha-mannosidase-like protein [Phytophthora cinnamomi]